MASRKAVATGDARLARGRTREGSATFPVAPAKAALPTGYAATLGDIKQRIQDARVRVVMTANSALVLLYWDIGRVILDRQGAEGWGAKVIDRLADDLRGSYPQMTGLSARNLKYMRAFAAAWPDRSIVQEPLAQLPWSHQIALLEKLSAPDERLWYARRGATEGWSQPVLTAKIESREHERAGKAVTNFNTALPPAQSELAAQVFKDPYLFDFLGTADARRELEVEQALVDHIQQFLIELGVGFAFVGRQVRLEVGDQEFVLDLLFYHLKLRAYVVVELKAVAFEPSHAGQLNFYLSAVDDLLRHPDDKPTIGLLLCREKNKVVVEYALRDMSKPIGVAQWETQLVESLPESLKGSLPTIEEIEAELGGLQQ